MHHCERPITRPQLVLLAVALFPFALLIATLSHAQNVAGIISEISGEAHVQRGTQTLAATPTMAIAVGDRITTERRAHLTITLSDASKLELAEASTLVIDEHVMAGGGRASTKLSLLGGTLRSIVASALRGVVPNFQVRTPNSIAGVRGTIFMMTFISGISQPFYPECFEYTEVGVQQGAVEVSNPDAPGSSPVTLYTGQATMVACKNGATSPGPLGVAGTLVGVGAPPATGAGAPPACPVCVVPMH